MCLPRIFLLTIFLFLFIGSTRKRRKEIITIEPKPAVKQLDIIELKPKPKKNKSSKVKIIEVKEIRPKETKWIIRTEVDKHRDNIRTILCCSNATPIGRYGGIGYGCCFCNSQYQTATELKSHTNAKHEEAKSTFMKNIIMANFIVKLDITNLQCTLCFMNHDSLEGLVNHLKSNHSKPLYTDIEDHILPFKFDNAVKLIKCVICGIDHNNFKVLLEHMNTHFRNHICNACGAGFVNKRILQTHAARHRTGVFTCTYCAKVFNNSIKRRDHERAVHVKCSLRSKCGYCGEKFSDYTKKNTHEVREHGAKPTILICQACEKEFDNQRALTVHTKHYHLMHKRLAK